MNELSSYNRIERYLLGQMSPQERASFESELECDPVLAEQLAVQRREHEAMEVLVQDRLREQLKRWGEQYPLHVPVPWYQKTTFWLVAASLLLLLGFFYFAWPALRLTDEHLTLPVASEPMLPLSDTEEVEEAAVGTMPLNDKHTDTRKGQDSAQRYIALAERYAERPRFQQTVVRSQPKQLSTLDSAYWALEKGYYTQALQHLKRISPNDNHYISARHLMGEVFLANAKYAKAIPYLQQAASTPDYLRKSEAEWQLALALLYLEKADDSRRILRRISQDATHPRYTKAKQLLDELQ